MRPPMSSFRSLYTSVCAFIHSVSNRRLWKPACIIVGLIAIQTLLLGYSIGFNFNNIVNGGDTQPLLNPQLFIQRSFFTWLDSGTGIPISLPGPRIFYAIPLYILNLFCGNMAISTFMLLAALFSLSSVSMFLLSIKITGKNGLSFFISIFYSLNLYTAIVFHTPVVFTLYLFGATPLLVLLFTKMESSASYRKKLFYLVIYLLFYLPLVKTLNMFVFYLVLVPLIGFIINFGIKIPIKRFLKYFALTSFIVLLVALPFLFPLFSGTHGPITPNTRMYSKVSATVTFGQEMVDSIRFIRTYAWKCPYDESFSGILSYSFLKSYGENPFLIFISFYPILIVLVFLLLFYLKLRGSDRQKVLGLALLVGLSLFIITPSLTAAGSLLLNNEIGTYVLRSVQWKYSSIPYVLCLSLILAFLLKRFTSDFRTKRLSGLLLILFLIHLAYISPAVCIYGKTINQSWVVQTPESYYDIAEFLNQQDEEFRILPVPIPKSFVGYIPYKWGYVGPDILYTLTNKPLIGKMNNTIAPAEYLELTEKLEVATPRELIQECQTLNVKYILLRNDVDTKHPYNKVYNSPEYYENILENSDAIGNKYVFGDLVLYELENYTPRVFLVPTSVSGNNPPEKFFHSVNQFENTTCLHFVENLSTPITLETSRNGTVESFKLDVTFAPEQKKVATDNWQILNYTLIHTNLLKVAFSPKGVIYTFVYLKGGTVCDDLNQACRRFERMGVTSTIKVEFENNNLSVYLNDASGLLKLGETNLEYAELVDWIHEIKIGGNMGGTERYVGGIYGLNLSINGENVINTQELFSSYPSYVENETFHKLDLTPEKVEWKKISPTKYTVTLNDTLIENEFFLVFLNTYDPLWKAYCIGNESKSVIPEDHHIKAFGYANAWYLDKAENCTIVLEYTPQRIYNLGLKLSLSVFAIMLLFVVIPERRLQQLKTYLRKKCLRN